MKMDVMANRINKKGIKTVKWDDPTVDDCILVVFKDKKSVYYERFIGTFSERCQRGCELLKEFRAHAVLSDVWDPNYMEERNYD